VFYLQVKDLELRGEIPWGRISRILEKREDKFFIGGCNRRRRKVCNSPRISSGKREIKESFFWKENL